MDENQKVLSRKPILDALDGKVPESIPIWLMRQAGRYLPEYRKIRKQKKSFLDLCYSPKLAAEITLQPIRRFGFDAAILFSDILVLPDALGQKVWFEEGVGPRLIPVSPRDQLNPPALAKPKVAEAVDDIQNSQNEVADNPFEATPDGTLEHIRRMEAAADGLRNNEQPRILDESSVPVNPKENRPVAYDTYLRPDQILFDAETFQFKTGGDKRGVKDTLAKVNQWYRDAAGSLMVYEKADGTYFVADGHQRLGLAKRLSIADPDANIIINTTVRRELDGFTPEEVMAEAMIRNVQNGTADAVDVARALRVSPEYIGRMANKVAPNSQLYRLSKQLYKLSDDSWGYFMN